jgi:hypothetical protein
MYTQLRSDDEALRLHGTIVCPQDLWYFSIPIFHPATRSSTASLPGTYRMHTPEFFGLLKSSRQKLQEHKNL